MELQEKLQKLRNKFNNNLYEQEVNNWCKKAEDLALVKSLKEHDGVKILLSSFVAEVELINRQLLQSDSLVLPDYERDLILIKKGFFKKFIEFFEHSDKELKDLEKKIDINL